MLGKSLVLSVCIGLLAAAPRCAVAQDAPKPDEKAATAQPVPAGAANNTADIQWLWGEVVSVDAGAKTLAIKYLDYDTDEEKTMNVTVTDTTTFQEAKGLDGIKPQNTVSIEYTVKDEKNIAKDITVENIEDADTGIDQPQTPPEKVGSGPVTETEGPVKTQDQPQGQ